MLELVLPSTCYRRSYLEALIEYHAAGRCLDRNRANFGAFVAGLNAMFDPAHVETGSVAPATS